MLLGDKKCGLQSYLRSKLLLPPTCVSEVNLGFDIRLITFAKQFGVGICTGIWVKSDKKVYFQPTKWVMKSHLDRMKKK